MQFRNESEQTVHDPAIGVHRLRPGATVEIADAWAHPRRATNGARVPSVVENHAPQLKPADPADRVEWERVPDVDRVVAGPARQLPTVDDYVRQGVPRGLAALLVATAIEGRVGPGDAPPAPTSAPPAPTPAEQAALVAEAQRALVYIDQARAKAEAEEARAAEAHRAAEAAEARVREAEARVAAIEAKAKARAKASAE